MITASHNTCEYNGLKFYTHGHQILGRDIEKLDCSISDSLMMGISRNDYSFFYTDITKTELNFEDFILPINYVKYFSRFEIECFDKTNNNNNFIFCGLQGVGTTFIKEACKHFNIDIDYSSIYNELDSDFNRVTHPNPEIEMNWTKLFQEKYKDNGIYFMCDGDGDRFGMGMVKNNNLIRYNPNIIARIFLWYFLQKQDCELILARTYLTDKCFQVAADKFGLLYAETKTGSKYLAEAILNLQADNNKKWLPMRTQWDIFFIPLKKKMEYIPAFLWLIFYRIIVLMRFSKK